jgi:hypothetical protein
MLIREKSAQPTIADFEKEFRDVLRQIGYVGYSYAICCTTSS